MKFKLLISAFIISLVISNSSAQQYGNEWINYAQKYYKISTVENGIHRITYNDLAEAGFPVATVDPRNIQLIHRGVEQAIHIEGQGDGVLNNNDFLEFYGKRNDGTLDEELYISPDAYKRKYHNFYSDTSAYFLTWSLSETGKRFLEFRENNILNLPPESYHVNESTQLQTSNYSSGLHYPNGEPGSTAYLSVFDYGEGWTGGAVSQGQSADIIFSNLENGISSGPNPILEILLSGRNNLTHTVDLLVGGDENSLRSLATINFNYYYDTLIINPLEWTDISNGMLTCRVSVPNNGTADRVSISYARLTYAESWDNNLQEQKVFQVEPTNSNRSYIEIQNVPAGAQLFDITDENNLVEIGYNPTEPDINAVIENDLNGRKLLLTSRRIQAASISVASMRNIDASKADFLIITHKDLRKPGSQYQDVPKAYGSYRASPQGGGYDTLVINMDQLYNAFSYGEYTSLAIYRFCRFMAENGTPKYLFLMGKGLAGNNLRNARNGSTALIHKDFVPTAGFPGSDMLFTAGLNGTTSEPGFAVGRISAKTTIELEAYFNKVKEFESTPKTALWHKELVHLSGGGDSFQQSYLRTYVDGFKSIAEGDLFGGDVTTFSKRTTEPEEFIDISGEVNKGKILVTFFGHSGQSGSDMDIGKVSEAGYGYDNKGKYPLLIVNGCLAGDMFNAGYGLGEDWMATPDKGAIGFIAHSNTGEISDDFAPYLNYLRNYTNIFYEVAFTDSSFINMGVGDIQKETAIRYLSRYSNSEKDIMQVQQMTLQGDPSISIFSTALPDIEINADNVFLQALDGEPINAFTEVFNLGLIVQNFGRTFEDSIKITVSRKLSNGDDIPLDTLLYKSVYYKDTLFFPIKSQGLQGFGINQFSISIDPLNEIEEMDETNNSAMVEEFIMLGGTGNIHPLNYSIVNKANLKLVAQSMDLLLGNKNFQFELDTTKLFNSLYHRQTIINANTLAKWEVNLFETLPEQDSIVFYWKTNFTDDTTGIWNASSFTYIKDSPSGWAMNHFQQYEGAINENVFPNQANRKWEFEQFETMVSVRTFGASHEDLGFENVEIAINGSNYIFPTRLCTNNSMNFVAFDKANTVPYLGLGKTYILDRRNCGKHPSVINNMLNSEIENNLRIEQYIDAIGDGDFVVLFSIGNVTYPNWPASTWAKLAELGINSSDIVGLMEGEPLIISGKKGSNPGTATVVKADYSSPTPAAEQEIFLETTIHGRPTQGVITSPRIGPSSKWISFHQNTVNSDSPPTDMYTFNIYGINAGNEETLIYNNISATLVDLQSIDHPYLRIEMLLEDEVNLTPPQLNNWFVIYDGFPEGVISFKEGQSKEGNNLAEGEIYQSNFAFENVSDIDFTDSISVEFTIFNQDQRKSYMDTIMIKPLLSEEAQDFSLDINTLGKVGINDLTVFANRYLLPEQNYNNNFINLVNYFNVEDDTSNPIMEVTVDGEFIMDGDIVAPSPMIVMRLKDENATLLKEDTLGVNIYLNEKGQEESTRISFSSPNVNWNPATAEDDFTVEFQPQTLADGIYTLKAEAADASGNSSGTEPYSVSFEIINESQITNFFPYPNPFSTRTQFVFTLTGSDIPDEIIIQIMTVNGTVIREITQDEIGPIKIGHNKTEYAWDGRDEYGDQLANGVYLYKVKIYNSGEEMKHRGTSADRAFKHGVGKIYLLK